MTKTGVYIRVSTLDQNIDGQKTEIQQWLAGQGIVDAEWYVDKATGTNLDRPAFDRLQHDIFAGRIKTVVVWKLDRLSRSLRDGINVLSDWCDQGLRIVATSQRIDFNGSLGKMLAAVLLAVAEMENETRRERQAAGIAAAKARGVYKGGQKGRTKGWPVQAKMLSEKGLTHAEIAKTLGVSTATVYRYIKQGKEGK